VTFAAPPYPRVTSCAIDSPRPPPLCASASAGCRRLMQQEQLVNREQRGEVGTYCSPRLDFPVAARPPVAFAPLPFRLDSPPFDRRAAGV
jgi:hypothetical protein